MLLGDPWIAIKHINCAPPVTGQGDHEIGMISFHLRQVGSLKFAAKSLASLLC